MKSRVWLPAFLAAMIAIAPLGLHAQADAKKSAETVYTVGKDETVVIIAGKLKYPAATENQMMYAIVKRNPNAFSVRTKQRLLPGTKLVIPTEAKVLSYKAELADREVANLRQGEALYQDSLAAEKAGDVQKAVKGYIASARLGHPLADLRLGQLYDKDASKTLPRDLQESIAHYQKAREFGIDVKGPTSRAPQVGKPD